MKRVRCFGLAFGVFILAILAGCGGGGGGGAPVTFLTQAVLELSTSSDAGTVTSGIGKVSVTINLPPGATVNTDASGNVSANVVVPAGVATGIATAAAVFTPATGNIPAQLNLTVTTLAPGSKSFGIGHFATVSVNINPFSPPKQTDFTLSNPAVFDVTTLSQLSGISILVSAFQLI
jgi:hypothetical protein